ncbi:MAG TPA: hypothetical protein VFE47_31090 [Tepidisphaeraceae bacterium]|jgi:DNA repair exonuclease SbcCD ATPase subunit|nr:hypothetical protein [Tepidisphaeraceae bacterium]
MKWLVAINLLGVMALAALSAFQWSINRDLNLEKIALEKTTQEQARKITEQEGSIKNITADLDDFRSRLTIAEDELKKQETQIATLRHERDRTIAERDVAMKERDAVKASLAEWEAAVKQRDETLKKASGDIQKVMDERQEAITRFNELAIKYNGAVKDLNEARAKLAGAH